VCVSYQDLVGDPIACVAKLHRSLVDAGAVDLQLPTDDEIRAMIDPELDRHSGGEESFNRSQSELRDALRSGAALQWESVPPVPRDSRDLLSTFVEQSRENASLRKETREREMLIDAVFASRSWRLGFALTRLWRKVFPSREQTAVDRWKRHAKS